MVNSNLDWIVSYIWGIADDVLPDLYVRGKYRDVILPMTVLRRLDTILKKNQQTVLDLKASLDTAGIAEQDQALRASVGQAFYKPQPMRSLEEIRAPDILALEQKPEGLMGEIIGGSLR
jgi:type I restriction enzyme M protein